MSTDNGIYIGKFPAIDGFEYRVIEAQAIGNLCYFSKDDWKQDVVFQGENPREIYAYFKDASVFKSREAANAHAYLMDLEIKNEYGIRHLSFFQPFQFYKDHAKEIVYPWDKAIPSSIPQGV